MTATCASCDYRPGPRNLPCVPDDDESVAESLRRVADAITDARSLVVLTGAGMSAASGVPTFRGAGGLWKSFRAEDLATAGAVAREPAQHADVFLTVGTSSQVSPTEGLVPLARAAGALVVEINPEPAASDDAVDVRLPMGADQALLALDGLMPG